LRTGVQHGKLVDVHFFREDARRHITDQRHIADIRNRMVLGAFDGVVVADVEVIRILVGANDFRQVGPLLVFGRTNDIAGAELGSGFNGFLRPLTGQREVGLLVDGHEVERQHVELEARAALQKQDVVIVRHTQHFANQRFAAIDDGFVRLGTVRHFHHGLTGALVIEHLGSSLLQNRFRQNRRAGGKVVNAGHRYHSCFENLLCFPGGAKTTPLAVHASRAERYQIRPGLVAGSGQESYWQ